MFDATADRTAILFQLGFTWSSRANPAPLAREAEAAAFQPRKSVAQLSELNLKPSSCARCALGKNIQDQFTAIHHWAIQQPFQVVQVPANQIANHNTAEADLWSGNSSSSNSQYIRVSVSLD